MIFKTRDPESNLDRFARYAAWHPRKELHIISPVVPALSEIRTDANGCPLPSLGIPVCFRLFFFPPLVYIIYHLYGAPPYFNLLTSLLATFFWSCFSKNHELEPLELSWDQQQYILALTYILTPGIPCLRWVEWVLWFYPEDILDTI